MIWVLGCSAVLMVFALAITVRTVAVFGRHRAEAAVDLAALAAAGRIGVGGDPCAAAAAIARRNAATLTSCSIDLAGDGRSGTVIVRIDAQVRLPIVGVHDVIASARAGRLPAAALKARPR